MNIDKTNEYQLTVLMGAPGAGKSTWVKRHRVDEYVYNTEGVRIDRDLDIASYMHQQRVKAIKAVESGSRLIADGTHTIQSHRLIWLNLAKRLNLTIRLIAFNTPVATCLAVQKAREYPAPDKVVRSHSHKMHTALQQAKREGWSHVEIINR
jgi:predicted kinase